MSDQIDSEISDKTKVSLKNAAKVGALVVGLVAGWFGNLMVEQHRDAQVDRRFDRLENLIVQTHTDCITQTQLQKWKDGEIEANRAANASVIWLPIPDKVDLREIKE